MTIRGLDYWYDAQQRRFLEQIVRAFSGFQYETGWRDDTPPQLVMVPCRMASPDRMVQHINKNLSENTLLTVPMITVWQSGLSGRRQDLQNTQHVDTRQVIERGIDPDTGKYNDSRGRAYTVHRMMPRPFDMMIQVDIWTSNLHQKYQLSEQILTVMYPDFAIQNSDNPLDWTALTMMTLDDITWSSRSMPIGTENEIDVMTLQFRLPILLSPPAKVKEQKIIEQIVVNLHEGDSTTEPTMSNLMGRDITTPGDHFLRVEGGKLTLLGPKATVHDENTGDVYDWKALLQLYGTLRPTLSQIRLKQNPDLDDSTHDIIGTIQYDALHPNELFFQIDPDTLPANTLPPVEGVINPIKTWPGNGLPGAVTGQRYLLIHDVAGPSEAWGTLRAHANDIIQYQNGTWVVVFEGTRTTDSAIHHLLNTSTGRQLRWTGTDWVLTVDGDYPPGMWRIAL